MPSNTFKFTAKSPLMLACAIAMTSVSFSSIVIAKERLERCVMKQFKTGDDSLTLAEIRENCNAISLANIEVKEIAISESADLNITLGAISSRILNEKTTEFNPYVITPHKMTYILPAISTNRIHNEAYQSIDGYENNLSNVEAKFQVSLKAPLNTSNLLFENDALYIGFTLEAWWQIYAQGISKPFRETNYQPEIFYLTPVPDWHPFGGNVGLVFGLEHQSNGRGQELSRSWNRFYAHFLFEKERFALSFKPWYRLPEKEKEYILDPDGDDNPDIEDYMGHFELGLIYKWDTFELGMTTRHNFSTNKGFVELGFTFPLWGKLKGYLTASDGYGESLIDYNYTQTRFGLGIALNNVL